MDCDMLQILNTGNPNGDYYQGVTDQIMTKAAYLMTLVNIGFTTHTAFKTLSLN
jgi:hypothetical protein